MKKFLFVFLFLNFFMIDYVHAEWLDWYKLWELKEGDKLTTGKYILNTYGTYSNDLYVIYLNSDNEVLEAFNFTGYGSKVPVGSNCEDSFIYNENDDSVCSLENRLLFSSDKDFSSILYWEVLTYSYYFDETVDYTLDNLCDDYSELSSSNTCINVDEILASGFLVIL